MGSVCGDYHRIRRQQLYSLINALKRENDCLKTDLIKYKLLSNKCQKYLQFLGEMNETIETNTEKHFISQINALKDIKNCFICLNKSEINESLHQLKGILKSNIELTFNYFLLKQFCNQLVVKEVMN